MTHKAPFADLPTLLAWIDHLDPPERVHIARLLSDTNTTGALSRIANALVYDMTRDASRAEVANHLGITVRAVQRAISSHIAHTGAARSRGPAAAAR